MTDRPDRSTWLLLLVLAGLALYVALSLRVRTDITAFMPAGTDAALAQLSKHLSDSELSRTAVLTIGADELATALAGATRLAARLEAHPEVAWLRDGMDFEELGELHALYFPRRHGFLSDAPDREIPALLEDASLVERARRLRRTLASPRSSLVAATAEADPLGAFGALIERMRADASGLDLEDGHFVTDDRRHAVLFFGTRASAFDAPRQERLQSDLSRFVAEASAELGRPLSVEQSGAGRFGVRIRAGMLRDVRVVVAASVVGVVLLFLAFFRSLRALAVVLLPATAGVVIAAAVGLLVFGSLNGLSVAFGLALAGVSIDYSIHLFNHLALAPASSAGAVARRLRPSLLLGGATTVASLAGVAFSNFPGFHQMGLLAAVGVGSALGVALFWIPRVGLRERPPALSLALAGWLARRVSGVARARTALWTVLGMTLVAGLAAIPRLEWVDDLRELTTLDAELLAEEERVRGRVAHFEAGRFAVILADDWEGAVAANDRLYRALGGEVERGALDGFRSLHRMLWSAELQRRNERLLRRDETLPARLEAAYAQVGFRPGAFRPFAEALRQPPPEPLSVEELRQSSLGDAIRPLVAEVGEQRAVLTYLRGIRDEASVRAAVESVPGATYFDQRRFVREVYEDYRKRTLAVVASGCLAVFALLLLRYRRLRPSFAAFLPSLVVALLLAVLAVALDVRTNLLHLVGLVLVMGMGVDYGIFVVDSRERPDELGYTLLSLLICCLTTIFIFGVLSFSEHPVLRALGATAALGVTAAFLLAPLSLLVAGPAGEGEAG